MLESLETDTHSLQPFSRFSPPRNMLALAVIYPSGRIEVYKVEKFFPTSEKLRLQGNLRLRRFKQQPEIVRDNYKEKTLMRGEQEQYQIYYI